MLSETGPSSFALGKRHISIVSTRKVIWTFFRDPHPLLKRHALFFDSVEALEGLFILQTLRFNVVYKSINVHLGHGQDLIMSMQIY